MPGSRPPAASRRPAPTRVPRALLLAVLLTLVAGCTSGDRTAPEQPAASGPPPVGAAATTTRGAELRAALTWLLTEQVHLVVAHARALRSAQGRDEPEVVAARRAVDASTEAAAETLGGTYSGARDALLPALRAYDTALLAHTSAVVTGEERAAAEALSALEAERTDVAAAVRRVVPNLRVQDVEAALTTATAATLDAVRASVEDDPRAPALQRAAHEAAWATARLLAVGVSTDRGLGLAGSPATELRGRLTGLLTEHVLLAGDLAGLLAVSGGDTDDPAVRATATALDAAAVSLAELLGRSAPETALPVLTSWRKHLEDVQALAVARATRAAPPPPAQPYLERLQAALSPYADTMPPGAGQLGVQAADSLRQAVDAAATGSPSAREASRTAAADTVAPAALVAAALAERLQLS